MKIDRVHSSDVLFGSYFRTPDL